MKWQSLDTAPPDGEEFQAWVKSPRPFLYEGPAWPEDGFWEPRARMHKGVLQVWFDGFWEDVPRPFQAWWMPQPGAPE